VNFKWEKPVRFPTSCPLNPGFARFPARLCPAAPASGSLIPDFMSFLGSLFMFFIMSKHTRRLPQPGSDQIAWKLVLTGF
jgi:hypothetical protein